MSDEVKDDLIADILLLSSLFVSAVDTLGGNFGVTTSARLQVLKAIVGSPVALPVAHIARNLGLTRQAVQRLANEMERDALVRFEANPHHQRAKLVLLTASGRDAYDAATKRQASLARELTQGLTDKQIRSAAVVLKTMRQRLRATIPAARTIVKSEKEKR
jgi:DNA-binding MarR family transcriptional regulator